MVAAGLWRDASGAKWHNMEQGRLLPREIIWCQGLGGGQCYLQWGWEPELLHSAHWFSFQCDFHVHSFRQVLFCAGINYHNI